MTVGYVVTVGSVTEPNEMTWDAAFASRDIDGPITAWYQENTGHDTSLSYAVVSGELDITTAWLNANNGNGRVSYDSETGRWLVERYQAGSFDVQASNVTLRNFYGNSAGALYGLRSTTNATGLRFEYGTVAGNFANPDGAAINFPNATLADQITFSHVDFYGYRSGIYTFGGTTAEYCWSHDLFYNTGTHNTAASIRGGRAKFYRTLLTDGNSSALSLYPEQNPPYTDVLVEECILRQQLGQTVGPDLLLASGRPYSDPLPGETRIVRNCLFAALAAGGAIGGYMAGFTELSGNHTITGAAV